MTAHLTPQEWQALLDNPAVTVSATASYLDAEEACDD